MDFKQIQELIKMINKSNIGEVSIEQKDFKITVRQKKDKVIAAPATLMAPVGAPIAPLPPVGYPVQQADVPLAEKTSPSEEASTTVTIKSPMIGTFYRKPSPDKPNFVDEGDSIVPGKTICVIEAMKLFNEIEAEISGKIVKVLVEDASPVEFDQPLFIVEP